MSSLNSAFLTPKPPASSVWGVPGRVAPGDCSPGAPADPYLHFAHTSPHIMSSLRDGSLSESALRLVPDAATVVVSWTRFRVSMHPPCFPPTVS